MDGPLLVLLEDLEARRVTGEEEDEAEFLRTVEVARRLNVSVRRVQMLLRSGRLPGTRLGSMWLVPRGVLEEYLERLVTRARENLTPSPCGGERSASARVHATVSEWPLLEDGDTE